MSNTGPPGMARSQRFVLAALDIGSTYSGYAYTFKSEYEKDRSKLYGNRWGEDGGNQAHFKAPTVVLFDKNKTFDSLGYEAQRKYASLAENGNHDGWRYFRYFKMELYREDQKMLHRKIRLRDDQGKRMLAVDVFAAAIKGLVDHLIKALNARALSDVRETDVEWLITVPAIWTDGAKQFMQLAAKQAGLSNEHVSLALEPEAAAVYTSQIGMQKCFVEGVGFDFRPFDVKEKFMVIDLGGGTVDMTFHEVTSDGGIGQMKSPEHLTTQMRSFTTQWHTNDSQNICPVNGAVGGVDDGANGTSDADDVTSETSLAEIHAPEGGHWGGNLVNEDLEDFMKSIFTASVWNTLTSDTAHKVVSLEVTEALENAKRNMGKLTEDVNISIPPGLLELFLEKVGLSFKEHIEKHPTIDIYATKYGRKWRIKIDKMIKMFDRSLERLISCLEALNESKEVSQINTLVLVGGFAESSVVQRAIRKRFHNKRVVVPEEASLAVVKGAVMYGYNNHVIRSRIMKHTYGICVAKAFDASIHPEKFKVTNNRGARCENIFEVMIEAGAVVIPNETRVTREFNGSYVSLSTQAEVSIYISSEKRPMFVTDDGCSHVGSVEFSLQRECAENEDRLVEVTLHFGHTKITVTVTEKASGRVIESRFNCLN